jgi:hypothetical protein
MPGSSELKPALHHWLDSLCGISTSAINNMKTISLDRCTHKRDHVRERIWGFENNENNKTSRA